MADINRIILCGRLTQDPENRMTESGISITRFTLAVNHHRGNGNAQANFIDCITWRGLADVCRDYLHKGKRVALDGRLQIRSFSGNDGVKRKKTEVVVDQLQFLDSPRPKKEEGVEQLAGVEGGDDQFPDEQHALSVEDRDVEAVPG